MPTGPKLRKRRYIERPDVRETLLDAAEALIRQEGYAAATARAIASRVGLKHQVVFYYFGTQDDLLLAVYRRAEESYRKDIAAALASDKPIRAMWDAARDPEATKLTLEFMALANHNDTIRSEIAKNTKEIRALEAEAVARHLRARGIEQRLSSQLVSILTNGVARLLVQEATLGIRTGHKEAEALVNDSLRVFETKGTVSDDVAAVVKAMTPPRRRPGRR